MSLRRALRLGFIALGVGLIGPALVPQALAFPYHARSNGSEFWSERPLPQVELNRVAARAAALIAHSPLAMNPEPRHVFLTDGGWRWTLLALRSRSAFGLTRPLVEAVILNRNDLRTDRIFNGADVGGSRSLSGVLAHEVCHGMLRRHFGLEVALKPTWLVEGYCDHVAQESSLKDADAKRLRASRSTHPALPYYEGRRRVADALRANGNNVDAVFAVH